MVNCRVDTLSITYTVKDIDFLQTVQLLLSQLASTRRNKVVITAALESYSFLLNHLTVHNPDELLLSLFEFLKVKQFH